MIFCRSAGELYEMTQGLNPVLSKPVNRKSLLRCERVMLTPLGADAANDETANARITFTIAMDVFKT
jgi:hypothetical protein